MKPNTSHPSVPLAIALVLGALLALAQVAVAQTPGRAEGAAAPGSAPALPTAPAPAAEEEKPWYDIFDFSGNFRFRSQVDQTEMGLNNTARANPASRYRMRYRLLLDLKAKLDDFDLGLRLGTSPSATSTNESFDKNFGVGGLFVRRAYASAKLAEGKGKVTVGRWAPPKNTFFRTILTLDSDIALTGARLSYAFMMEKTDKGKVKNAVYFNLAGLFANEVATGALREDSFGTIVGVDAHFGALRATLNFWGFAHAKDQYANFTANGDAFTALEFGFTYGLKSPKLKFVAHAVLNFGADTNEKGMLVGVSYGSKKKAGDFKLDLLYWYLEAEAWPIGWSDADSDGDGTPGSMGIELNWFYRLSDSVMLGMENDFAVRIGDQVVGGNDTDGWASLIFDIYFDF